MVNTGVSGDKLGSEANPIVIYEDANDDCGKQHTPERNSDTLDKLGSESNPIVINADANDDCGEHHAPQQDVSDGDTEPLSTPEFWATFDDGGSHVPQNNPKSALTNSNCDLTPCKSKYSQSPVFSGSPELEFPHAYLEEERSEAANSPKIEDSMFIRIIEVDCLKIRFADKICPRGLTKQRPKLSPESRDPRGIWWSRLLPAVLSK
jgi:hypothetical protein